MFIEPSAPQVKIERCTQLVAKERPTRAAIEYLRDTWHKNERLEDVRRYQRGLVPLDFIEILNEYERDVDPKARYTQAQVDALVRGGADPNLFACVGFDTKDRALYLKLDAPRKRSHEATKALNARTLDDVSPEPPKPLLR